MSLNNATSNSTSTQTTGNEMFGYDPSLPMAWIGAVLFTVTALLHIFQYFKLRAFYLYLLILGILMEASAYWTRVVAIKHPNNGGAVSMSYLLITLAPSFLAAACYMTFGRIVYLVTPENRRSVKYTWVPIRFITTIFVALDFLAFFVQCIGIFVLVGNATKKDMTVDQQKKGVQMTYDILRVGFTMQILVFFSFMVTAFHFMFASKSWRYDWPDGGKGQWRIIAWAVVAASGLVTVRSLFRCLMFAINRGNNYARDHEWTFYMFDMLPVLIILILFNIFHPGQHIPIEYTTVRHDYKRAGFRIAPMLKEVEEEEETAAGYSRVSLVPPPLAPPANNNPPMHVSHPTMTFTDPWNNQPSPGVPRY